MNGNEIIELARRTYLEELSRFVLKQAERFQRGAAEVQTLTSGETALLGGHFRVDFIAQRAGDAQPVPINLIPDNRLRLDTPLDGAAGAMRVRVEQIVWDDVEISHDITGDLTPLLKDWFEHWYDPDDRRKPTTPGGAVDVIHSVTLAPGKLVVDFGSASPSAFWALVALLRDAGASAITIRETRPPPKD